MQILSNVLARVVVLSAAVLVALTFTFMLSTRAGIRTLLDEARYRTDAVVAGLFAPVEKYDAMPKIVSDHPLLTALLGDQRNESLAQRANTYLAGLAREAGVEVVYLLNRDGLTVASSNWDRSNSFVGTNYAFRPYFRDALSGGAGRFYGLGVSTGLPGYYISAPVPPASSPRGVLVFKVDLTTLDQAWSLDPRMEAMITDEYGIAFLSSRPEWKYRPLRPLSADQFDALDHPQRYNGKVLSTLDLKSDAESVSLDAGRGDGKRQSFVMEERKLPGTNWTARVLMSTAPVDFLAVVHTGFAAFTVVAGWLLYLYWRAQRGRAVNHAKLAKRHAQLKQLTAELRRKAITDSATGCYNRSFFFERMARLAAHAHREGKPLSIVMLDVDHFKSINDNFGHPAGDTVLKRLVRLCKNRTRDQYLFARFGGEEFIIALAGSDAATALQVADKLRKRIGAHVFSHDGAPLPRVTISCGVAQLAPGELDVDAVIRRADAALYAAKRGGRNRVVMAPEMPEQAEACAGVCEARMMPALQRPFE